MRKVFRTLLAVLAALSLIFSGYFMYSMVQQYDESVKWDSSSLLSEIHNVPPELAKNYVTGTEEDLAQTLTDINSALENISENEGMTPSQIKEYSELYERADSLLKVGELQDTRLAEPVTSLSLYLASERAINNAYESISIEDLKDSSDKLVNRLNTRDNKMDEIYLNRLTEVANDYRNLERFSKEALNSLGFVEGDILYVDKNIKKSDSDRVMNDLREGNLLKFTNIKRLEDMLKGQTWNKILDYAETTRRYHSWEESKQILESLHHSDYIPVTNFVTLSDVLNHQPNYRLNTRLGYEIDIDSSTVNRVYYEGRDLSDDMYVKNDSLLEFDINYVYNKIDIFDNFENDSNNGNMNGDENQSDKTVEDLIKDSIQGGSPQENQDNNNDKPQTPSDNESDTKDSNKENDRDNTQNNENNTDGEGD